VPLQWNHVVFSFDSYTERSLTRVNGVSDAVLDPNVKQLLNKRWDTCIQQAGFAALSSNEGMLRSLKILSPRVDAEEVLLMRRKPRDLLTIKQREEMALTIASTQQAGKCLKINQWFNIDTMSSGVLIRRWLLGV